MANVTELDARKTSDLLAMRAPYNPRTISDHDLAALRRSLREWGIVQPVVVNTRTNRVVGGHQRVVAAQAEGIAELPVRYVDLDEVSEKKLNLALNRISGEWDDEALRTLLVSLNESDPADLDLTGFSFAELEALLREDSGTQGQTDPDDIPEPLPTPATQRGDRIVLGDHVLFCGDSASEQDLDALLAGERVHLLNTDPPYNVRVEPRSNNAIAAGSKGKGAIPKAHHQGFDLARDKTKAKRTTKQLRPKDRVLENDFMADADFEAVLRAWFSNAARVMEPGRSFYIWGGYANVANYPPALVQAGLEFHQAVIWVKDHPVLTRKDFMGDHEWCFYGWKAGAAHYFNRQITNARDVWHVKKVPQARMVHLTEKPVELAELAMVYSSRRGENVLDLFGGSGSTIIAAEKVGRRAFAMEIDPSYCDVIVMRWEAFTGREAQGWRGRAA